MFGGYLKRIIKSSEIVFWTTRVIRQLLSLKSIGIVLHHLQSSTLLW
jgi:hypothetical protein